MATNDLLRWAQRAAALAQNGLTYAENPFDIDRYTQLRALAAEMLAAAADTAVAPVTAWLDAQQGYATPRLDVRGAAFHDQRILLVRERSDGGWTMPGGFIDVGDRPGASIEREIREESGFEATARKLIAVYDRNAHDHPPFPFHMYKLFFLCELTGGAAATSIETSDVGFFAEDALPPLSLGRISRRQIERAFAHHRDPALPADFD